MPSIVSLFTRQAEEGVKLSKAELNSLKEFTMRDGLLFKKGPMGLTLRLCIPTGPLRRSIIALQFHTSLSSFHKGRSK